VAGAFENAFRGRHHPAELAGSNCELALIFEDVLVDVLAHEKPAVLLEPSTHGIRLGLSRDGAYVLLGGRRVVGRLGRGEDPDCRK